MVVAGAVVVEAVVVAGLVVDVEPAPARDNATARMAATAATATTRRPPGLPRGCRYGKIEG